MNIETKIKVLLEERAPWLARDLPHIRLARLLLNWVLSYKETINLANKFENSPARTIMQVMASRIASQIDVSGENNIPASGGAMIVANHPTGLADGIVLNALVERKRSDSYIFANLDIIRILPQFSDVIAPVEWVDERKIRENTRNTLQDVKQAVKANQLGIIFPSGRIARRHGTKLKELPWMPSAFTIARKANLPIVPVRIRARNSWLYYLFDVLHPSLRDITLFHELLNKEKQIFSVHVGEAVWPAALSGDAEKDAADLYALVMSL